MEKRRRYNRSEREKKQGLNKDDFFYEKFAEAGRGKIDLKASNSNWSELI